MAIATEITKLEFINVEAGVDIPVTIPTFAASDVVVQYKNQDGVFVTASVNTDYEVTLGEDFNTFTLTFTQTLVNKLVESKVVVSRELNFETSTTPPLASRSDFVSRELDRAVMRDQQLNTSLKSTLRLGGLEEQGVLDATNALLIGDDSGVVRSAKVGSASDRANKYLYFDGLGNPSVVTPSTEPGFVQEVTEVSTLQDLLTYAGDRDVVRINGVFEEGDGLGGLFKRVEDARFAYQSDPKGFNHILDEEPPENAYLERWPFASTKLPGWIRDTPLPFDPYNTSVRNRGPIVDLKDTHHWLGGDSIVAQGTVNFTGRDNGGWLKTFLTKYGATSELWAFSGSSVAESDDIYAAPNGGRRFVLTERRINAERAYSIANNIDNEFASTAGLTELGFEFRFASKAQEYFEATGKGYSCAINGTGHNERFTRDGRLDIPELPITSLTKGNPTTLTVPGLNGYYHNTTTPQFAHYRILCEGIPFLNKVVGEILSHDPETGVITIDCDSSGFDGEFVSGTLSEYDTRTNLEANAWAVHMMHYYARTKIENENNVDLGPFHVVLLTPPTVYTGDSFLNSDGQLTSGVDEQFEADPNIIRVANLRKMLCAKHDLFCLDILSALDVGAGDHDNITPDTVHPDEVSAGSLAGVVDKLWYNGAPPVNAIDRNFLYRQNASYRGAILYRDNNGEYTEFDEFENPVTFYEPTISSTVFTDDSWAGSGDGVSVSSAPAGVGDESSDHFVISDGATIAYRDLGGQAASTRVSFKMAADDLSDIIELDTNSVRGFISPVALQQNLTGLSAYFNLISEVGVGGGNADLTFVEFSLLLTVGSDTLITVSTPRVPIVIDSDGYVTIEAEVLADSLTEDGPVRANLYVNSSGQPSSTVTTFGTLRNTTHLGLRPAVLGATLNRSLYIKDLKVEHGVRGAFNINQVRTALTELESVKANAPKAVGMMITDGVTPTINVPGVTSITKAGTGVFVINFDTSVILSDDMFVFFPVASSSGGAGNRYAFEPQDFRNNNAGTGRVYTKLNGTATDLDFLVHVYSKPL